MTTAVKVEDGDPVAAITAAEVKKTDVVITSSSKKTSDIFEEKDGKSGKKTDVVTSSSKRSSDIFEEEDGKSNKKGGIEIVEFENGGGEIYVGEGEDWVERLKDFEGWNNGEKWQRGLDGLCDDQVQEDGNDEEIVWQDDVFKLRDIKEVPKVDQRQKSEVGKPELEKC